MHPHKSLFSFRVRGSARGRTFYVRAESFGDASREALAFIAAILTLDNELKTITLVADACDMVDED